MFERCAGSNIIPSAGDIICFADEVQVATGIRRIAELGQTDYDQRRVTGGCGPTVSLLSLRVTSSGARESWMNIAQAARASQRPACRTSWT